MFAIKEIFDERPDAGYKRCHCLLKLVSACLKRRAGNCAPLSLCSGVRGFSLVEVLVAMTILSIGILGITGLAGTSVKSGAFAQNMTQATNLAQDRIEALQSVLFITLHVTDTVTARTDLQRTCTGPVGPVNRPVYTCTPLNSVVMGGKTFTWTYIVTFIDLDGNGTASESSDALKRLDVVVTWRDALNQTTNTTTMTAMLTK